MKCTCGNPMRQHIVALNDIWWICIICGRQKQAEKDSVAPRQELEAKTAGAVLKQVITRPANAKPAKVKTGRKHLSRGAGG